MPGSVCPAQRPKTRAGSALSTGRATRRARGALDTLQASPQVNSIKVPTSVATRRTRTSNHRARSLVGPSPIPEEVR